MSGSPLISPVVPGASVPRRVSPVVAQRLKAAETALAENSSFWKTVWGWVKEFVTGKTESVEYDNLTRFIKKIDLKNLHKPEVKQQVIENCDAVIAMTQPLVDKGVENIKNNRPAHEGISVSGVPLSAKLKFLTGNTRQEIYQHNAFLNYVATAIKYSVANNIKLELLFDLDGCISSKTRRPFATRDSQSIDQLHEFSTVLQSLSAMGALVISNTNRSSHTTNTWVTPKGFNPVPTEAPHYGALMELAGLSAEEGLIALENTGIAALSTGFIYKPKEGTTLSFKLQAGYDILQKLGRKFRNDFGRNEASSIKASTLENKAVNQFLMFQKGCGQKPSYVADVKINAIYERYIKNDTPEEWRQYQNEIFNHIHDRTAIESQLKRLKALYEENLTGSSNAFKLQAINSLRTALQQFSPKSDFTKLPNLTEGLDEESIKHNLDQINLSLDSFIYIPGEETPSSPQVSYTSTSGENRDVPNLYFLLCDSPKAFHEEKNRMAQVSFCIHYDNPQNIKISNVIQAQVDKLDKNESDVRSYVRESYHRQLSIENPELRTDENKALTDFIKGNIAAYYGVSVKNVDSNLSDASTDTVKKDLDILKAFAQKAREMKPNNLKELDKVINLINWRLCQSAKLKYSREFIKNSEIFEIDSTGSDVKIRDSIVNKLKAELGLGNSLKENVNSYISFLQSEMGDSQAANYEVTIRYLNDILLSIDSHEWDSFEDKIQNVDSLLCPDFLYCRNYTNEFAIDDKGTKQKNLLPLLVLEDKSDIRIDVDGNPVDYGLDYCELLPNQNKGQGFDSRKNLWEKKVLTLTFGDSKSDLAQHVRSLFNVMVLTDENGQKRVLRGAAVKIYNLIKDEDFKSASVDELCAIGKELKNGLLEKKVFSEICEQTGMFALEKVQGGYKKIIGVDASNNLVYEDKVYTDVEMKDIVFKLVSPNIYANEAPDANIRRFAEAVKWIFGADIELNWEELLQAKALKESGKKLNAQESVLVEKYRVAIAELQYARKMPLDTTADRKYVEYHDPRTGRTYYRMADSKKLMTKDGKHEFHGNTRDLRAGKRLITLGIDPNTGMQAYVYEDKDRNGNIQVFHDVAFLDKCAYEDSTNPFPRPISGMFQSKFLLGLVGGKENLRKLISNMPMGFSKLLEWSGGLMAVGGVLRLLARPVFGADNVVFKAGYWLSNVFRGVSAIGGGLRGLINPHKYYSITLGETINLFSAMTLPNGLKHIGLAFGNLFLFTGRGIQSLQRQLSTNIEKNGKKDVDPKLAQESSTKFSTQDTLLHLSDTLVEKGVGREISNIFGSAVSACLTPFIHIFDVIKDPSLLMPVKDMVSQKSGKPFTNIKSVGHLLSLTGFISGISAAMGGIFGRYSKFGEVDEESGFNAIGKVFLALSTAVPALGIIANGLEVKSNSNGNSMTPRLHNGKTMYYNPRRAGWSQVFAGVMYGVLPMFDLSKDWVAAAFDAFGTGAFFGLPGTNSGVAEEEKNTALLQADDILFSNGEYFNQPHVKAIRSLPVAEQAVAA